MFHFNDLEKDVNNMKLKCGHCKYVGETVKKLRQHISMNHREFELSDTIEEDQNDKIANLKKFVMKL